MSRLSKDLHELEHSFPRVSGDEPRCRYEAIMRQQFSPRERG